jgi:hypothetical protein
MRIGGHGQRLTIACESPPFQPTRGEGGVWGVLMLETGDGTQGLSKKPAP